MILPTKEEKNNFSKRIQELIITLELSPMEAIVHHCESTGLEVEVAATLINENLKMMIREEAEDLRFLKEKSTKLPL